MKDRTDIFLIHGISKSIGTDYYDKFVRKIRDKLPIDADIDFHPIDYSSLLADKEKTIYSWMKGMSWQGVRRFACDYLCDVLAWGWPAKRPAESGDFVYDVQEMFRKKYQSVQKEYTKSKKVIIGHSLGSVIAYQLTWDFHTDCLITAGSPMLYFSIRYAGFGSMNPNLKEWVNFWRSRDPVSTIISRNPQLSTVKDIEVKSWNPLDQLALRSHSLYWSSEFVSSEIAGILKNLQEGLDISK